MWSDPCKTVTCPSRDSVYYRVQSVPAGTPLTASCNRIRQTTPSELKEPQTTTCSSTHPPFQGAYVTPDGPPIPYIFGPRLVFPGLLAPSIRHLRQGTRRDAKMFATKSNSRDARKGANRSPIRIRKEFGRLRMPSNQFFSDVCKQIAFKSLLGKKRCSSS